MSRYFEEYGSDPDSLVLAERGLSTPPRQQVEYYSGSSPELPRHRHQSKRRPPIDLTESLSTIKSHQEPAGNLPVKEIYEELQLINKRLQDEFRILHEREMLQKEKERSVAEAEESIHKLAEEEVERRWKTKAQKHQTDIEELERILRDKNRENRRLKENFDTLKLSNESLRKELECLQDQNMKLEKQSASLQARLTNLQRKQEHPSKKEADQLLQQLVKTKKMNKDGQKDSNKSQPPKPAKASTNTYEVLGVVLEWLSDVHLRHALPCSVGPSGDAGVSSDYIQEKCIKILPSLVELLRDVPSGAPSAVLPCLQFTYWSLVHTDQIEPKTSLSSTLRRLGEELYQSKYHKTSTGGENIEDRSREGLYFHSGKLHVRFLSCLIILKTVTQVDHLAHVFETLRRDLKQDMARELFMHYQATAVILPYLRPTTKTQLQSAVDICLQMAVESPVMQAFLDSCSTEEWFRICSLAFRFPGQEERVLEKLSIILQKLSKIRSNKKYFEVFGISTAAQEMSRTCTENTFLLLNLKSVLFNLGCIKPQSSGKSYRSQEEEKT